MASQPPLTVDTARVLAEAGLAPEPSLAEQDDADLGIGEDEVASSPTAGLDMAALMADPAFAKLVADAVATKLAGSMAPTETKTSDAMFDAFLSRFDHMLDVTGEQKPGYVKPLTPEEVDARRAGQAEMKRLLRLAKERKTWPSYLLADEANPFYGPSPAGPILYQAGQEINWRGPPAESFKPLNEEAVAIFAAYKRWVGEPVSIEELTRQAVADARGVPYVPEYMQDTSGGEDIQVVDAPVRDVAPKRTMGTFTPEVRGRIMPGQPGVVAQPAGPIFVDG